MTEFGKILSGIFLVLGLHILAFLAGGLIGSIAISLGIDSIASTLFSLALFIGISQLIYISPLMILLIQQRNWGVLKGVIIGAVITALLNGGCWLWWIEEYFG
jgi:hypothetical protein